MEESWRDKLPTEKQIRLIRDIEEFAERNVPHFDGTTRGDASDWIAKYGDMAHESDWAISHGYD